MRRRPTYSRPADGRATALRLDFNENTAGCSPAVRRALARLSRQDLARYPEYDATRRRLARGFGVRADELLLTCGTDDALRLTAQTVVRRGDRVLLVEPTFAMYRVYAGLAGGRVMSVRYGADLAFPMASVMKAISQRPRLFFLANPNSPTGTLLLRSQIRALLDAARESIVLVDEAYFEFSRVTVLPWIRRYSNLLVTRTFSKAAGLAGLRIGCLFGAPRLLEAARSLHAPYAVNAAALVAAEAALGEREYLERYTASVCRTREWFGAALARRGVRAFPSAGNFVLADFGPAGPRIVRLLRQQGIRVRDRTTDFGRAGFVRITIGTRAQMHRLLSALDVTGVRR